MKAFRIQANAIDTIYDGETKGEALEAYAKDAGYKSYEDLVRQHGEVDSADEIAPGRN